MQGKELIRQRRARVSHSLLIAKTETLGPNIPSKLPKQTTEHKLRIEPTGVEVAVALRPKIANSKTVGKYGLRAELLNLELSGDRSILTEHNHSGAIVRSVGEVPKRRKDATFMKVHKKRSKTEL